MFTKFSKVIPSLVIGGSLLMGSLHADVSKDVHIKISSNKDVVVETNTHKSYKPIVYAKATKKSYEVNKPINFALKLNQKSFIYIWTIPSSGKKGYRILPNKFESYNAYKPHIAYVVPEKSANYMFVSDRAGVEHVYIVATNKKLSKNALGNLFKKRSIQAKEIKNFVTKDIKIIAKKSNLKYQIAKLNIKVKDKAKVVNRATVNININQ